MRQGKAKYLFPGNNTPKGFISHYHEGLRGMQQIFILKGGPGVGKSTLMRKIGTAMLERGYDCLLYTSRHTYCPCAHRVLKLLLPSGLFLPEI